MIKVCIRREIHFKMCLLARFLGPLAKASTLKTTSCDHCVRYFTAVNLNKQALRLKLTTFTRAAKEQEFEEVLLVAPRILPTRR